MKTFAKIIVLCVTMALSSTLAAAQDYKNEKYLAGAVTEENGYVVFRQDYNCPGQNKDEIYQALEQYAKRLLKSKTHLEQCRISQATPDDGVVAASMEETLTFKSTNWILDTARFFYQVVFTARDGGFEAMMRRIHYIYEPMEVPGIETALAAEDWITDREALNRKGLLRKVGGKKFRRCTIDRKDEVFDGAYKAVINK